MSWNVDFVAPNKAEAIRALMHPLVSSERGRGMPVAVREQVITMVEMISEQDSAAFVQVKTHGHLTGPQATGSVNMNIEIRLVPSYVIPGNAT